MYRGLAHTLTLFFSILFFTSVAQSTFTSQEVESKSYNLFVQNKWKELIKYGDSALTQGIDYYYLRMRLGIANYEQKKYLVAEKHFVQAIEFNVLEDLPKEYLYFCYLFTDRYEEARWLTKKFSTTLAQKMKTEKVIPLDFISLSGGQKISDLSTVPNANYLECSLGHYLFRRVSLMHAYTFYGQGYDTWDWAVFQNQYYLKISAPFKYNFLLSGAFHFVDRLTQIHPRNYKPLVPYADKVGYNYVGSFSLQKKINAFDASIGSTLIWLDSLYQYQHDFSLNYYPFQNKKLAVGASLYFDTKNTYSDVYYAFTPYLTYKPVYWLSVFGSYFYNSGNNITEWNGYLVNNSPDLTESKWTLNTNISLHRHWDINATYQYENKLPKGTAKAYIFNTFIVGLKYKL